MRKRPTKKQRQELFDFYGVRCVARGEMNENELDVAHIDDDHTNTVFENLLPLCKNLNGALNDSKGRWKPDMPNDLFPAQLANKAWTCFRDGAFPASYGCYRLASELALKRLGDISRALDCLSSCIAALRPIGNERLLHHVMLLTPNVMANSADRIDPFWKGEFLSQLGLVLCDFQMHTQASICQEKAQHFYRKSKPGPWKLDVDLKRAAAMRRYALVHYNRTTLDKLKELLTTFRKAGHFGGEATTLHVEAILEFEERGSISQARDSLEAMLQIESKIGNPWLVAELHFFLGRILLVLGEKKRAMEEFELSRKMFLQHQTVPVPSKILGALDPSVELRKLGLNAEPLRQRATFPLSKEELRRVISLVENSR